MAQLRRPGLSPDWPVRKPKESGVRRSIKAILDSIDRRDPAFTFIAVELQRIRQGERELTAEAVAGAVAAGREHFDEFRQGQANGRAGRIPASIVYYIRRGNLVKIGTTTNPRGRFRDLLPDEILAWEPGGREEEAGRHRQFRELRVSRRGEYFRRDDSLDGHIGSLVARHGAPDPTWPTIENLGRQPTFAITPGPPTAPDLVTMKEGAMVLGIRYNTACVWRHRGKIKPFLTDGEGKEMFLLSDLRSLAEATGKGSRRKRPDVSTDASGPEWLAS